MGLPRIVRKCRNRDAESLRQSCNLAVDFFTSACVFLVNMMVVWVERGVGFVYPSQLMFIFLARASLPHRFFKLLLFHLKFKFVFILFFSIYLFLCIYLLIFPNLFFFFWIRFIFYNYLRIIYYYTPLSLCLTLFINIHTIFWLKCHCLLFCYCL